MAGSLVRAPCSEPASSQGRLEVVDEVVAADAVEHTPGFDLIRVVDGMCTEHWGVQDNLVFMQQIGAVSAS